MNIKIKKRIELIRKGILPENYENNDAGLMPQDWKISKLGNQIDLLTDYHANGSYERLRDNVTLLDESGYAIMVRTTNFENKDFTKDVKYIDEHAYNFLKKSKVYPDDIIINKIANAGAVYIMPDLNRPVSLAMNIFLLRTNKCNSKYLYHYLKYNEHRLRVLATGTSTKTITKDDVRNLPINIPDKVEQNQICKILSTWDKAIELKEQLIEEKKKQKSGLMQKLLTGKVRLPGFDGEWTKVEINELTEEISEIVGDRNIKPIAVGVRGIRQRDEIYKKELSADYSKNKVIRKNYLCFGIGSKELVYDVLIENNEYCVSPAYKVYKINKIEPLLLKLILDINKQKYSSRFMIISARQGKSVDFSGLMNEKIRIPEENEQKELVRLFELLDKSIDLLEKDLESLKLQKKGLMQLLLTGIVRVQC